MSTATPPQSRAFGADDMNRGRIRITEFDFDFTRVPLRRPLGFKGAAIGEKWVSRVSFTGSSGCRATAYGGYAVLWSDDRVFLAHSECGANALMASVTEFGIQ